MIIQFEQIEMLDFYIHVDILASRINRRTKLLFIHFGFVTI